MTTIHLVSHTHWDREWYLPFQLFRLKLVRLIDSLLDIMAADPEYRFFMLDGQTIVLDDYLEMRPEREAELRELIQTGRILIGPWHVLPDEFLVSPEAIVRNLLHGDRMARHFGPKMAVGYIPDPFGHIGQMPQILDGFGIQTAVLQRGLADQPVEFWWQAPDGTQVLMAFLRDGYGNAALIPMEDGEAFRQEVQRLSASLHTRSATQQILLMHGTDHTHPSALTPQRIREANGALEGVELIHSTLPGYIAALRLDLEAAGKELPVVCGELRSSQRWHMLPGVLSARTWIKQRNHTCETLLEKWAEPFSVFATQLGAESTAGEIPGYQPPSGNTRLANPAPILRRAWGLLLENHPHDSICGCSIDQVHAEMEPRFDQVEQIGEEITAQSLEGLAGAVNTIPEWAGKRGAPKPIGAAVVFNSQQAEGHGIVSIQLSLPEAVDRVQVLDEAGNPVPHAAGETEEKELAYMVLSREEFTSLLGVVQSGKMTNLGPVEGMVMQDIEFERQPEMLHIHVRLTPFGKPSARALAKGTMEVMKNLQDGQLNRFTIRVSTRLTHLSFLASGVPGLGYKTFWITQGKPGKKPDSREGESLAMENEFLRVEFSREAGVFHLEDWRSGVQYRGLNGFIDGGDCGDEYNYCPPEKDELVQKVEVLEVQREASPVGTSLHVRLRMLVPAQLSANRRGRSPERAPLEIITRATLQPGSPRLDFETTIVNPASDHRLRVHFPAPIPVDSACYDGHFEVVRRPVGVPASTAEWAEEPRPEQPQRNFTDISDGRLGLMVANRGLREVEVLAGKGRESEIALTLLRCVGWLSRDDFANRKGHAGPGYATPGAQMHGTWTFHYAVIPHEGSWEAARLEAEAFNTPLRAVNATVEAGRLPGKLSLVQVSPASFAVTAIKEAENGRGWILRGVNLSESDIEVQVRPWKHFARVERISLIEQVQSLLEPDAQGTVQLPVRAKEIVTLRFIST